MQRIIMAVIALAAVGIVTAFAASQVPSHEAGAAPPCGNPNPPAACTPTPTVSASPTAPPTSAPTPTATESPPPQSREDQITMFSQAEANQNGPQFQSETYAPLYQAGPILIALDASDYPASTVFRFEGVVGTGTAPAQHCLRLFDLTANTPVTASEICNTIPPFIAGGVRVRSAPFTLPTAEHEYTVEGKVTGSSNVNVYAARIIAEWTERR